MCSIDVNRNAYILKPIAKSNIICQPRSVVLSFCSSVDLPFGRSTIVRPSRHLPVLSFCHSVVLLFCCSVVLSFYRSIVLSFNCSPVLLFCSSVVLPFCRSSSELHAAKEIWCRSIVGLTSRPRGLQRI